MTSRFQHLFESFCLLAGLGNSTTVDDNSICLAATLDGVDFELLQSGALADDRFFSRVIYGPLVPADDPQQWSDLLAANMAFFGADGLAFSREPASGQLVLQRSWPGDTPAEELFQILSLQFAAAREWRSSMHSASAADDGLFLAPQKSPRRPAGAFERVCGEFCELASIRDFAVVPLDSGGSAFMATVHDVDIWVCHLDSRPQLIHLYADLVPLVGSQPELAGHLAEANAWLAADRMGTTACLRLATQDYVLRCVMPLGDATNGAALLRHLAVQARAVLSMREQIIPVLAPGPQGGMGADFS